MVASKLVAAWRMCFSTGGLYVERPGVGFDTFVGV
jgi:hypothetical protein